MGANGRTLYLFTKDSGTKSACSGACAAAWPPLRANGKPAAGSGASAALVGTTGGAQVTYNGHPLYYFVKDKKARDTNGEGLTAFGGTWFAVSAAGNRVSRAGGARRRRPRRRDADADSKRDADSRAVERDPAEQRR